MNIAEIIGKKLREVQKEYNYNQEKMGEIVGVTRQTMAKYLSGEQILDSDKLYKIANHFNKPVDYFLKLETNDKTFSFMFRADDPANNFNEDLRNYIAKRFNTYHELIELSDSKVKEYLPEEYKLDLNGTQLSEEDKIVIAKIAEKQRKNMGIDDAIDVNVFRLFENNNIHIIAEKVDNMRLDALSAYSKDKGAFIFINDRHDIPEERKIFSLVHELGHLIMHRDEYSKEMQSLEYTNSRIKDIREKAADYFASCFLIPPKVLENDYLYKLKGYITIDTILEIKQDFGVSSKSLITTLNQYGIINRVILGKLFSVLRKMGFETQEPEPRKSYVKKNEKFINLVKQLVIQDKISVNKVSEILNLNLAETRKKVKEWKNIEYIQN